MMGLAPFSWKSQTQLQGIEKWHKIAKNPANCWKMKVLSYLVSLTLYEIGSAKSLDLMKKSLGKNSCLLYPRILVVSTDMLAFLLPSTKIPQHAARMFLGGGL